MTGLAAIVQHPIYTGTLLYLVRIFSVASIEQHSSTRRRIPEQSSMIDRKAGEPFQPCMLRDGILIPQALLKDPTLSASARLLWGVLADYQGKSLECFPDYHTTSGQFNKRRLAVHFYLR